MVGHLRALGRPSMASCSGHSSVSLLEQRLLAGERGYVHGFKGRVDLNGAAVVVQEPAERESNERMRCIVEKSGEVIGPRPERFVSESIVTHLMLRGMEEQAALDRAIRIHEIWGKAQRARAHERTTSLGHDEIHMLLLRLGPVEMASILCVCKSWRAAALLTKASDDWLTMASSWSPGFHRKRRRGISLDAELGQDSAKAGRRGWIVRIWRYAQSTFSARISGQKCSQGCLADRLQRCAV